MNYFRGVFFKFSTGRIKTDTKTTRDNKVHSFKAILLFREQHLKISRIQTWTLTRTFKTCYQTLNVWNVIQLSSYLFSHLRSQSIIFVNNNWIFVRRMCDKFMSWARNISESKNSKNIVRTKCGNDLITYARRRLWKKKLQQHT